MVSLLPEFINPRNPRLKDYPFRFDTASLSFPASHAPMQLDTPKAVAMAETTLSTI